MAGPIERKDEPCHMSGEKAGWSLLMIVSTFVSMYIFNKHSVKG